MAGVSARSPKRCIRVPQQLVQRNPVNSSDVLNRLAIRELHEAYGDAVLRRDVSAWSQCWAEDATWALLGMVVEGRAAIAMLWEQAMQSYEAVSFIAVPSALVIEGDSAHGRTQTHEILREVGGRCRVVGGAYDDTFVRFGAQWFYRSRSFRIVAEYPGEGA